MAATTPHQVDPEDFIRPDGSIDVCPLNLGDPEHVAAVNDFKRGLRRAATPYDACTRAASGSLSTRPPRVSGPVESTALPRRDDPARVQCVANEGSAR